MQFKLVNNYDILILEQNIVQVHEQFCYFNNKIKHFTKSKLRGL